MGDKRGHNYSGVFITLDAPECAGKGVHSEWLLNFFNARGYNAHLTHEPGGTPVGEDLRNIVKHYPGEISPGCELLIFAASRAQLVNGVIVPRLEKGGVVICDRFYDSTTAYQHFGRGLPREVSDSAIQLATSGLRPDLTFFIDILPEDSYRFSKARTAGTTIAVKDRFEDERLDFHRRVYRGYQEILSAEPDRVKAIPYIRGGIAEMQEMMLREVRALFERRGKPPLV